ncbi:MAG: YitT family protein, partial [Planctomycetes bacterium]|nr:YitT family protein [Planctomycetota bacterium]
MIHHITQGVFLVAGILVAAMGLESFLIPNQFIDGGVTGISMLLADLTGIPLGILLVAVNAPFVGLAYHHFGKVFAIKSSIAIIALAVA